jgi:hypothetical protein
MIICKLTGLRGYLRPDSGITISRSLAASFRTRKAARSAIATYNARSTQPPRWSLLAR